MLTAGIILALWGLSNDAWKNIIEYYLIPFLHLVTGVHLMEVFVLGFPARMEISLGRERDHSVRMYCLFAHQEKMATNHGCSTSVHVPLLHDVQ